MILINFKNNVNDNILTNFFEFVDPFMQNEGFDSVSESPKLYLSNQNIPANKIKELLNKMKKNTDYNKVIQTIYFGKLIKV